MRNVLQYMKETFRSSVLEQEIRALLPAAERDGFFKRLRNVRANVQCPHNLSHSLSFIKEILALPASVQGCIVEAGCFKGGSTAQFSIAAKMVQRPLVVFDSFEGLPANDEQHDKSILGGSIKDWFREGEFRGALEEVQQNITEHGEIAPCRFVKGWFENTLPGFREPVAAAYIDVDLASSTKTCLKFLYPLLQPGGVLMSQDGDFPLVIDVFRDERFWNEEVGVAKPHVIGLGKEKIIRIVKE